MFSTVYKRLLRNLPHATILPSVCVLVCGPAHSIYLSNCCFGVSMDLILPQYVVWGFLGLADNLKESKEPYTRGPVPNYCGVGEIVWVEFWILTNASHPRNSYLISKLLRQPRQWARSTHMVSTRLSVCWSLESWPRVETLQTARSQGSFKCFLKCHWNTFKRPLRDCWQAVVSWKAFQSVFRSLERPSKRPSIDHQKRKGF